MTWVPVFTEYANTKNPNAPSLVPWARDRIDMYDTAPAHTPSLCQRRSDTGLAWTSTEAIRPSDSTRAFLAELPALSFLFLFCYFRGMLRSCYLERTFLSLVFLRDLRLSV